MQRATAKANANVALAKYWGKRDETLNLPFKGSLSVTLAGLETVATVRLTQREKDRVTFGENEADQKETMRISRFLDLVRSAAGCQTRAQVEISSNFPVAAGIASSASTFAALALAATTAYGVTSVDRDLSILARRGSGSASRSIFAGFVEWLPGKEGDGSDSYAIQVAPPQHWPLGIVVAITDPKPKPIGSREGMALSVTQSPFFAAWLETHDADLDEIRAGVRDRDLERVGLAAEHNCLKMHAVSMATKPPLLYWRPATIAVIDRVRRLREAGVPAYFTIDAGPQVKVICAPADRQAVADALAAVPGVHRVLQSEPGEAPTLMEAS